MLIVQTMGHATPLQAVAHAHLTGLLPPVIIVHQIITTHLAKLVRKKEKVGGSNSGNLFVN